MLETEAKQKWCPFARIVDYYLGEGNHSVPVTVNRLPSGIIDASAKCLVSECACWVKDTDYKGHCGLINNK